MKQKINYKAHAIKDCMLNLALIKLCYLQQALQITTNGASLDKKKLIETKPFAFKTISPIASKPLLLLQ